MNAKYFSCVSALLMSLLSLNAQAATGAIKVTSVVESDVEVLKAGKKELKRMPVSKAVPGAEVIFTTRFENVSDKVASDVTINNPIAKEVEYKAGSAFGADCEIVFSADGGKTFAAAESLKIKAAEGEHNALPKEYTNVRWIYKGQLAAGKASEVGFRAVIK
ncbi:MAG: hypothetical protein PXX73_05955 [Sideroxydans sp.]|nr:hypothetical protein [Sideroxydans sp.]